MSREYDYGYGLGLAFDAMIATDPPVSEKQRRAMYAAKAGKSTLGIPKKVGEEFVGKDELTPDEKSRLDYTKSILSNRRQHKPDRVQWADKIVQELQAKAK